MNLLTELYHLLSNDCNFQPFQKSSFPVLTLMLRHRSFCFCNNCFFVSLVCISGAIANCFFHSCTFLAKMSKIPRPLPIFNPPSPPIRFHRRLPSQVRRLHGLSCNCWSVVAPRGRRYWPCPQILGALVTLVSFSDTLRADVSSVGSCNSSRPNSSLLPILILIEYSCTFLCGYKYYTVRLCTPVHTCARFRRRNRRVTCNTPHPKNKKLAFLFRFSKPVVCFDR